MKARISRLAPHLSSSSQSRLLAGLPREALQAGALSSKTPAAGGKPLLPVHHSQDSSAGAHRCSVHSYGETRAGLPRGDPPVLGVLDVTPVCSFALGGAVGRVLHWGEGLRSAPGCLRLPCSLSLVLWCRTCFSLILCSEIRSVMSSSCIVTCFSLKWSQVRSNCVIILVMPFLPSHSFF